VPPANLDHPLAVFARDPTAYSNDECDDWEEVVNPLIKQAFGWGIDDKGMKRMVRKGKNSDVPGPAQSRKPARASRPKAGPSWAVFEAHESPGLRLRMLEALSHGLSHGSCG